MKFLSLLTLIIMAGLPTNAIAGPVLVEGQPVEGACSEVSIEKQVTEFREGSSDVVRLIPGPATYRVCVESRNLVPAIEAACAPDSADPFVDIVVEDGRSFVRCLVESSKTGNQPKCGDCGCCTVNESTRAECRSRTPNESTRAECACRKGGTRYCFRCEGVQ